MDRAEAIKRLEWLRMVGNHVDSVTLGSEDMGYFDMAIAALREQEQSKWISVKERLPEKSGLVIGYDMTLGVACFYFHADMITSAWQGITHWMPLPEPPKEGVEK